MCTMYVCFLRFIDNVKPPSKTSKKIISWFGSGILLRLAFATTQIRRKLEKSNHDKRVHHQTFRVCHKHVKNCLVLIEIHQIP